MLFYEFVLQFCPQWCLQHKQDRVSVNMGYHRIVDYAQYTRYIIPIHDAKMSHRRASAVPTAWRKLEDLSMVQRTLRVRWTTRRDIKGLALLSFNLAPLRAVALRPQTFASIEGRVIAVTVAMLVVVAVVLVETRKGGLLRTLEQWILSSMVRWGKYERFGEGGRASN